MITVKIEIKTNLNESMIQAKALDAVVIKLSSKIKPLRCSVHGQRPKIVYQNGYQLTGCCEDILLKAKKKLF